MVSQLAMVLPDGGPCSTAEAVPVVLRLALEQDEEGLARLLARAFDDPGWSRERVRRELTHADDVMAVVLAEDEDGIVATASARTFAKFPQSGYVHWVAVNPDKRGQRPGRLVTQKVIEWFRDRGISEVILETDDERLPAIATYLGLGFIPECLEENHRSRWSKVFVELAAMNTRTGARA